jgi:hypothetical protein
MRAFDKLVEKYFVLIRRIIRIAATALWSGILGAYAKLRKAIISFVIFPSVRFEQLDLHWTDFIENSYLSIFRKSVDKIGVALKSDNNGYFTWIPICICNIYIIYIYIYWYNIYILITSRRVLLRIKNISEKSCTENKNTHFVLNNVFSKIVPFMR